jgi:lysophospholipid acyltransferase (LPLAT)-like uncharacterized protein
VKEVEQPRPVTLWTRLLARLAALAVRLLFATVRVQVEGEEECLAAARGGALFATWHGNILVPLNHFRGRRYWVLVSLSRDGDFVTEFLRCSGMSIVRGSTKRRGVAAAREVIGLLEQGAIVNVAPDGPRGPARVVQPGIIYMAQRSGKPIAFCATSVWPRWEISSWDRFQIPKPFARARFYCGEPMFVASGEDIEEACHRLGAAIDELEARAERDVMPARRAHSAAEETGAIEPNRPPESLHKSKG